jgi:sulfate permease, SulP family
MTRSMTRTMGSAVNSIDASALERLEVINHRLKDGGIAFHMSEVKGPVMDRLKRSHFLEELTGKVHLSQFDAVSSVKSAQIEFDRTRSLLLCIQKER